MLKSILNLNGCCDGELQMPPWKKCDKKSESEPDPEPEVCNEPEVDRNIGTIEFPSDFIIVGGGPGGILTAYKLAITYPEKKILLLEQNSKTLCNYKSLHDDVNEWINAQNDSDFQYSFPDVNQKKVWMGKGLGGGTLHFGLQFIDQNNLINQNYSTWNNYFEEISQIINPDKYSYESNGDNYLPNREWYKLYEKINENNNMVAYNNKIYASNISQTLGNTVSSGKRLLLGDLIENMSNVTIFYDTKINKVHYDEQNRAEFVSTLDTPDDPIQRFYGSKIILSAGAIQTPAILQRSGIDCGNTLYDHAAITVIYKKNKQPDEYYTNEELTNLGLNIYNIGSGDNLDLESKSLNSNESPKAMHAVFRHTKLSDDDVKKVKDGNQVDNQPILDPETSKKAINYVYNMGDFWNGSSRLTSIITGNHPGGSMWDRLIDPKVCPVNNHMCNENEKIPKKVEYDLTDSLVGHHGDEGRNKNNLYNYRLMSNKASTKLVGVLNSSAELEVADLGFDPSNVIGHLQTRDVDNNWQTYYSTVAMYPNWLILTHSQANNLPGSGTVKIDENNPSANPIVTLNHFKNSKDDPNNDDTYANDILDAYKANHELLTNQGYILSSDFASLSGSDSGALAFINAAHDSIYHYHGTCKIGDVVNSNHKVEGKENLYLGDASVLSHPWPGSTSVPSAVAGYVTALGIINELQTT